MAASKVYQYVTNRVLAALKDGTAPWQKPWKAGALAPCNYDGRRYNGANFFFLSLLPFATPVFLTHNKIEALGGNIKPDQKQNHVPVFYWNIRKKKERNAVTGKVETVTIPMLLYFRVWNIEQCEGIPLPKFATETTAREFSPIEAAENIIARYADRPQVSHGGNVACYRPMNDTISMPQPGSFVADDAYYATAFHEYAHSTGHGSRLNRKGVTNFDSFGSHQYSEEELVAELTAAYLCAECGIDNTFANSAAYIAGWFRKLQNEPKLFMVAAGRAQKAADYIMGRKAETVTETADSEAEAA